MRVTTSRFVWLLSMLPCALLAQPDRIRVPIDARPRVVLPGGAHPEAQPQFDRGRVDPARRISGITVMLKPTPEQQIALERLLEEQQDPASPNFHKWLEPEEYADRFGISPEDMAAIVSWLGSQGLRVDYVARGRNWLLSSGTAAEVEAAFRTELHVFDVDGETHYSNVTEPSIPAALEPVVLGLSGLDDFHPRPAGRAIRPYYNDPSGNHSLAPADIARIYNIPSNLDGTGQKIAVVGETAVDLNDVRTFRSQFGLPAKEVQLVLGPTDPGTNDDALGEANLDLDWVSAVAPNVTIYYVYSTKAWTAVAYAVDQKTAPTISMSFGYCEQKISASPAVSAQNIRNIAQTANSYGITWIAATGDSGAAACDKAWDSANPKASNGLAVQLPTSVPEVTGVGGTEFTDQSSTYWNSTNGPTGGSARGYIPETGWNDSVLRGAPTGSTGGASVFFSKPSWQTGANVPPDNQRDVPDVALTASLNVDGYRVRLNGSWGIYGGTSAAAPVFAGIVALLNQSLGTSGLGNINPTLYKMAQTAPGAFHDITTGSNIVPCVTGSPNCTNGTFGFRAGPGYDQVTGLGSVDASYLISHWNASAAVATTTRVTASATSISSGATTVLTATVTAASGSIAPAGSVSFATSMASLGTAALIAGAGGVSTAHLTVYGSQLPASTTTAITASYGGGAGFNGSSGSISIAVTVPTATSAIVPAVLPDPVYQQADSYWYFTVRLTEIAGVPTSLTSFTIGGYDYSDQIQSWFGSASIPARGTLSADLYSWDLTVPATQVFAFGGSDAGGAKWTQQISIPFFGQQIAASMALTSAPGTVVQYSNGYSQCPQGFRQWFQRLNLQEQNGYEVVLTKFVAGGFDLTDSIASWFGSWRLAPLGALYAGICWPDGTLPTTMSYEIDGTDTAGNAIVATASVPFRAPVSGGGGALSVSPTSASMSVSGAAGNQPATSSINVTVPTGQQWSVSVFPANQQTQWLVVYPLSGTGPAKINLVASSPGFGNGAYTATLVVQSVDTVPQAINVPVQFTIGGSSAISIGGVAHGASFQHVYAPGMVLSVFGTNLAPSVRLASLPLPLIMAGVSATVNGIAAPLYYVSPLQLNIQVPYETAAGTALLAVSNNGLVATYSFEVSASAPGIYLQPGNAITPNASGRRGQIYTLFITGAGEVSPPIATGAAPSAKQVPVPLLPVSMSIGGVTAQTQYVGIPGWSVGTLQINFTVPPSAPLGVQPVVVTVGSAASAAANFTVSQ
ncbi:MAG: protease pro-enzyme activation domain-containing protein [Bryobacteraceae bacterium]|jgi:uncharacterized protein (TIGR03437 family)